MTSTVDGLSGITNYIFPVKSLDNKKDAVVLYCFDSHAYSQLEGIKGYDYIKNLTKYNGTGTTVWHIPNKMMEIRSLR